MNNSKIDRTVYDDPQINPQGLTLRVYQPGDEKQLIDLFIRVFKQERTLEFWRWKFEQNPVNQIHIMLAETPDGQIVGQYAGVPATYWYKDKTIVSTQIVDISIDEKYRKGLTKKPLYEQLVDYSGVARGPLTHFCYGFPNSRALRIARKRFKYPYQTIHIVDTAIKPLSPNENLSIADTLYFKTQKLKYDVRKIDRFDTTADALWQKCQSFISLGIIRDAAYLNWRYCDCPTIEYLPIGVFDKKTNELKAWAVFRPNYPAQKNGLLMDWLFDPNDTDAIRLLFRNIEHSARISQTDQLETWLSPNHPQFISTFETIGFRREKTHYTLISLPFQKDITLDWMTDHWFYTMGDADLF